MTRESLVVSTLVELADNLVDNFDVIDVLTFLCDRCVQAVDMDAAGVMLESPGGELQYIASSSDSMRVLELFQIQTDEGPCIDSVRGSKAIINRELRESDNRWPRFSPKAMELGFQSVHCLPMRLRGKSIGALNLFRADVGYLSDEDVLVVQGLADVDCHTSASFVARCLNAERPTQSSAQQPNHHRTSEGHHRRVLEM